MSAVIWLIISELRFAHRENPPNPKDGIVASSQRIGTLANRTTIAGAPQAFDISRQSRQWCRIYRSTPYQGGDGETGVKWLMMNGQDHSPR